MNELAFIREETQKLYLKLLGLQKDHYLEMAKLYMKGQVPLSQVPTIFPVFSAL